MPVVTNLYVTQGRIFAPDIVPYRLVITPLGTSLINQAFGFRDANWSQENLDYVFQDGTFEYQGGNLPITWLGFNDRRIVIQVLGDSDAAHAVYSFLCEALTQLTPGFQEARPLLLNEETSCTVRLSFDWRALLNPALVDLVSDKVKEFTTEEARRFIKGLSIRFTIGAVTADERLRDYGVSLFDQTIAVEPKANVPLSERIYFTYSPFDSDTHLKLISDLETNLSRKGASGRRGQAPLRSRQRPRSA